MILVFAYEQRFFKDHQGRYYTDHESLKRDLWNRYLKDFDEIIVFARAKLDCEKSDSLFVIDNPKVSFIDVPYYVGPLGFLKCKRKIENVAKENAILGRAYICRVPGKMGEILAAELRKKHIPYAVEVVGDPWDVFAPNALKHPLAPILRFICYYSLRKVVKKAQTVLYVTKYKLQKRYPANKNAFATSASDVILKDNTFISAKPVSIKDELRLVAIGSLEQMYKSPDIAINSVARLNAKGVSCTLRWLGDGKFRECMEKYAKQNGVSDKVKFLGNVSADEVRNELMNSDIYLHISRTEGLPRALVEAMAVGLPCIGSRKGGIPELLDDIALINEITPDNVAAKVDEFLSNRQLMQSQAVRNFEEAKLYGESILDKKRKVYYDTIIRLSR
jgi:glycosyltransferase involved in cell wall biosynthesis